MPRPAIRTPLCAERGCGMRSVAVWEAGKMHGSGGHRAAGGCAQHVTQVRRWVSQAGPPVLLSGDPDSGQLPLGLGAA